MTHHYSTDELEREAEAARREVAYTAETLKHKMTFGQMFDEAAEYFRHSDGSLALHNLKTQMRDNPLPLALVGAGLAWFFMGGGPTTGRMRRAAAEAHAASGDGRYVPDLWAGPSRNERDESWKWENELEPFGGTESGDGKAEGDGSAMRRAANTAGSTMSGAASTLSEAAGSAYETAVDAASSAGDAAARSAAMAKRRAAQAGNMVADRSIHTGKRVQRSFMDALDQEPLVIGAIGIAVGAAIAAMLPRTQYEDENIGPYRDQLRDEAQEAMAEGMERAKEVAAETYDAAKDEANRQGLTAGSERPMAEKVAEVAKSATETAEESARSRIEP